MLWGQGEGTWRTLGVVSFLGNRKDGSGWFSSWLPWYPTKRKTDTRSFCFEQRWPLALTRRVLTFTRPGTGHRPHKQGGGRTPAGLQEASAGPVRHKGRTDRKDFKAPETAGVALCECLSFDPCACFPSLAFSQEEAPDVRACVGGWVGGVLGFLGLLQLRCGWHDASDTARVDRGRGVHRGGRCQAHSAACSAFHRLLRSNQQFQADLRGSQDSAPQNGFLLVSFKNQTKKGSTTWRHPQMLGRGGACRKNDVRNRQSREVGKLAAWGPQVATPHR